MRYYENLFIVNPNYEQEKSGELIDSVKSQISQLDGKVLSVEDLGKKRLAYPIEKQKYGNYVTVQFSTENGSLVSKLEQWMKLSPSILAYITIRLQKEPTVESTDSTVSAEKP